MSILSLRARIGVQIRFLSHSTSLKEMDLSYSLLNSGYLFLIITAFIVWSKWG
jgi:hypothetical protein